MKHDWNSLQNYLNIHERVLRNHERYMESVRQYDIAKYAQDAPHLELTCHKLFVTSFQGNRVRVDISKIVEVDDSVPNRPRARTESYSYSANQPGGSNLIRYCSPHQDWEAEGSASHHKFHHKHDFTSATKPVGILGSDEWPHVSEFLDEVLRRF